MINSKIRNIFITGVSCIGKSTIGKELAKILDYKFYDLDLEIEQYFGQPISYIKKNYSSEYSFRMESAKALRELLKQNYQDNIIIALPPSGMKNWYYKEYKDLQDKIVIVLNDKAENILKRITFYSDDSKPILKQLTEKEKKLYLREIKKDITYYGKFYKKTPHQVDISGFNVQESVLRIKLILN